MITIHETVGRTSNLYFACEQYLPFSFYMNTKNTAKYKHAFSLLKCYSCLELCRDVIPPTWLVQDNVSSGILQELRGSISLSLRSNGWYI